MSNHPANSIGEPSLRGSQPLLGWRSWQTVLIHSSWTITLFCYPNWVLFCCIYRVIAWFVACHHICNNCLGLSINGVTPPSACFLIQIKHLGIVVSTIIYGWPYRRIRNETSVIAGASAPRIIQSIPWDAVRADGSQSWWWSNVMKADKPVDLVG